MAVNKLCGLGLRQLLLSTSWTSSLASRRTLTSPPVGSEPGDADSFDEYKSSSYDYSPEDRSTRQTEKSINSVTLLGRVGVDPQLRGTERHPVVSFSLATNLRYKPGGSEEYVSKTDWHNVAVFKPYLRESIHRNVVKGQRVLVQGRILYGSVEDKLGNVRHTTTIVADDVIRF